jgi:hypothetical protein
MPSNKGPALRLGVIGWTTRGSSPLCKKLFLTDRSAIDVDRQKSGEFDSFWSARPLVCFYGVCIRAMVVRCVRSRTEERSNFEHFSCAPLAQMDRAQDS